MSAGILRGLLLAVALIVLPHVGHIPPLLSVFFGVLWVWRFCGIRYPNCLPKGMAASVLMLVGIGLLVAHHRGEWGIGSGTALFVTALGLKLLELNKPRDVYLIVYLGFIVIAAQFLYWQNIVAAIYGLSVSLLLLACLVAVNQHGRLFRADVLRRISYLFLQALPMTAILFMVFPRVQAPAWAFLNDDKHRAQSGLGDILEPGAFDQLALSPKLAFRVKFDGAMPPKDQLYWRGPVFSFTDGVRWRRSNNAHAKYYQEPLQVSGQSYAYRLLLEPQAHSWVYGLEMPVEFDDSLRRDANYQLLSRIRSGEAAEFKLVSYSHYNTGRITRSEYAENRQLPGEPSAEVESLVRQLHGFDEAPERYLNNVLAWFRQQGFQYSLTPPLMPDRPIETFLFEAKTGFCNHYATAFVYLLRVADIPARVVTGYQGGEFNKIGRFLEVRQSDAHAWAEVWLDGKGWVRVDPTSAVISDQTAQDSLRDERSEFGEAGAAAIDREIRDSWSDLKPVEQFWNSLEYYWQRWIVSYGSGTRSDLLNRLHLKHWQEVLFGLLAVWLAVMLILAGMLLRPWGKRDDPVAGLYRKFCRKMTRLGVERASSEGPIDFAQRAKMHCPELARDIDEITEIFVRLNYHRADSGGDFRRLRKKVSGLRC